MLTLGGSVRRRIGSLEVEIYLQFVSVSNVCVLKVFHVIKCPFQCFFFKSFFFLCIQRIFSRCSLEMATAVAAAEGRKKTPTALSEENIEENK